MRTSTLMVLIFSIVLIALLIFFRITPGCNRINGNPPKTDSLILGPAFACINFKDSSSFVTELKINLRELGNKFQTLANVDTDQEFRQETINAVLKLFMDPDSNTVEIIPSSTAVKPEDFITKTVRQYANGLGKRVGEVVRIRWENFYIQKFIYDKKKNKYIIEVRFSQIYQRASSKTNILDGEVVSFDEKNVKYADITEKVINVETEAKNCFEGDVLVVNGCCSIKYGSIGVTGKIK